LYDFILTYSITKKNKKISNYFTGQNWNLEMLVFEERGKPEYSEKRREPTTNSTHI